MAVDLENMRIEPDIPQASAPFDVRAEACPRRLRFADEVIADTTEGLYLFERSHLPVY